MWAKLRKLLLIRTCLVAHGLLSPSVSFNPISLCSGATPPASLIVWHQPIYPFSLYMPHNILKDWTLVISKSSWSFCVKISHLMLSLTLVKRAKGAEGYKPRLGVSPEVQQRRKTSKKMSECHWAKCHINSMERCWNDWSTEPRGAAMGVLKLSHGIMHFLLGNSQYEGQLQGAFRRCCTMPRYA